MAEIKPLLIELRSKVGASRILYFEYHNSTENFVGIPFKFIHLVYYSQEYNCPGFNLDKYKDVNSELVSGIYRALKKDGIIINKDEDPGFYSKYPGMHEFFSSTPEYTTQQAYVNIPGISFPIGMIVLEWIDKDPLSDDQWDKIDSHISDELPRINAVISKYSCDVITN
ncbi:MAG: hypothetical protein HUJ56_12160 [Erysipelotrichaceae bacterium]|nr:hypothetical protein [Erysipelotrichaceae bacterium]